MAVAGCATRTTRTRATTRLRGRTAHASTAPLRHVGRGAQPRSTQRGLVVVRSASGNNIQAADMEAMSQKIKAELEAEMVTVQDTSGDGQHVAIDVVAACFEGKTPVQRQRMVYKAIWEELQTLVR